VPQELLQAQQRVNANVAAMVHAIANHQFERARALQSGTRGPRQFANPARQIQRRIWNALLVDRQCAASFSFCSSARSFPTPLYPSAG
jgi:hypothetical protein